MSIYNGRRAPNFSQYLEDLNAIPSPYDQAQQQQQDSFNVDAELALFTNTEFFDFDKFGDLNLPTFDGVEDSSIQRDSTSTDQNPDVKFLDLLNDGLGDIPDYPTPNFNTADPSQTMQMHHASFNSLPQLPNPALNAPAPSQPSPITAQPSAAPTSAPARQASTPAPGSGRKTSTRKTDPLSVEEAARIAAEEDKRRRNTAASARFRVKKKLREQALERTVKETTEKNNALEARVSQLELENRWLKNLITEKNGGDTAEGIQQSETEIAEMFKKFLASQKPEDERRASESKIGVGTI